MINGLIDQLKNRELLPEDRYSAILALIKFYNKKSLPVLTEVLQDQKELPEVRSAVALGMAKLGDVSIDKLQYCLDDESPIVRNYVVQAFGMVGEKAIPFLINALSDVNNEVFYAAADALGMIGNPAVPYLTDLLERGEEDAKCVAAWKLGEIKNPEAIPALVKAVKDVNNNDDILALSTWALGELSRKDKNNKSVISALYRASRHHNPEIKKHAIKAMTKARDFIN
jgi:HEAT repeat protein